MATDATGDLSMTHLTNLCICIQRCGSILGKYFSRRRFQAENFAATAIATFFIFAKKLFFLRMRPKNVFSRERPFSDWHLCRLSFYLLKAFILLVRVNTITLFLFDDKRMHRLQMTPDD